MLENIRKSASLLTTHDEDILIEVFTFGYDDEHRVAYNHNAIEEVENLINGGMSLTTICKSMGVVAQSFMKFLEVHPQIARKLSMASLSFQMRITGHMIEQSEEGSFAASRFLLVNRGDDWSDKPTEEKQGDNTPIIQINYAQEE